MLSSLVASPFPMDTPDRTSSSEEIEEFFGGILDYSRLGQDALLVQANQRLLRNKAFSIVNFPAQKSDYANFCSIFGELLPTYREQAEGDVFGIGDVAFKPFVASGERFATERLGPLPFHTSRSWSMQRPRFFSMLMKSTGPLGNPVGQNGESMLLRSSDALRDIQQRHPERYKEDLAVLMQTAVRFRADHLLEDPDTYPLIFPLPDGANEYDYGMRFKNNLVKILKSTREEINDADHFFEVLDRFESVLLTTDRSLVFQMAPGQLTFFDNNRVAHGRRPFTPIETDANLPPRHLFNAQVL